MMIPGASQVFFYSDGVAFVVPKILITIYLQCQAHPKPASVLKILDETMIVAHSLTRLCNDDRT